MIKMTRMVIPVIVFLVIGCATNSSTRDRILFSDDLIKQYNLSLAEIQSLQFYLSEGIVGQRTASTKGRKIDSGKLVTDKDVFIKELVIERNTPGIAVDVQCEMLCPGRILSCAQFNGCREPSQLCPDNKEACKQAYLLLISFEEDTYLEFSPQPSTYRLRIGKHGYINPDTNEPVKGDYIDLISSGSSIPFSIYKGGRSTLIIDKKAISELVKERRTLKGRKLDSPN